jgi:hypothetical protein
MWNLGRGRSGPRTPGGQGFDTVVFPETIGFGKDAYFDDKGNYLSDRLADETLAFIERNRGRPFFVYLADPGKSRQTPPSRVNRIRRTTPKPTAPVAAARRTGFSVSLCPQYDILQLSLTLLPPTHHAEMPNLQVAAHRTKSKHARHQRLGVAKRKHVFPVALTESPVNGTSAPVFRLMSDS